MEELPKEHRIAVVVRDDKGFHFDFKTAPIPEPGPSEILLRLSVTGVCGSDISLATGKLGPTHDILGHEGVGYVVRLGSAIPPSSVALGQRVGVAWIRDVCGTCPTCLTDGGETWCQKQKNSGMTADGTFAEYALVPSRYLISLPSCCSDEEIAPILCGGVTAYKALKVCNARAGQWVLVSGAGGGVGAFAVQYAKAMGYRVVAVDVGDAKREYCAELGADVFVNVLEHEDAAQHVKSLTGGHGVSAAVVAAGSIKAYQTALQTVAPLGTFVCVGIPTPDQTFSFHPFVCINKGVKIVGSAVGTRGDILEAIGFVDRGQVTPKIHVIKLGDLNDILAKFEQTVGKYVVRF